MDSVPGQTFLNYAYSWGASIVILGALFKLTHLPGGNFMLFIGMGTEVVVFFLSAFDRPFDKDEIGKELPHDYETDEEIAARLGLDLDDEEEDEETRAYLLNIVGSAKAIVENIDKISTSEILQKNVTALVRDLNNVSSELEAVRKTISEQDAKVVKEFMHDLNDTSYSLEKIIDTSIEYCDKILENKDDFSLAMENAKSIISLLTDMTNTSLSMVDNINKGLKIVSSDIYEGSDKTADAILSLTRQLQAITNQTNQFKDSKNKIKDVVDNGWDKIDDETTLFEVEKDAKTVSFGDERNEVEQVQFIVKTPDIKHLKELGEDLEANTTKTTFWDRVLLVLKKMFGWIIDLF